MNRVSLGRKEIEMIYVASSWRNKWQQEVVKHLRENDFDVFDFRNPCNDDVRWNEIWSKMDPNWQKWSFHDGIRFLDHPLSQTGFALDFSAMNRSSAAVMVMPCGKSAHLESGYFVGAGKPLVIFTPQDCQYPEGEPELMYLMASQIVDKIDLVVKTLRLHGVNI
jgi:hypothetical protein